MHSFSKEIKKYCSQNVTLSCLCCLQFRNLFLSETGVDPFCYCMVVYCAEHLKKGMIGIISIACTMVQTNPILKL